MTMDPGYRSPLIDFFRRGEAARDARLLAAQGAMSAVAMERLALLMLLSDDRDPEIASTADATLRALPEPAVRAFLASPNLTAEMRTFFAGRGLTPAPPQSGPPEAALEAEISAGDDDLPQEDSAQVLSGLPIKTKLKLASKGTREQRAQLIRDPNKLVAAAVLSSPKLTDAEIEAFARMQNVGEDVLRVIGSNRTWLKNYGVVAGLVRNAKTPPAVSMQLLPRINERDLKMLSVDRNVPEALRLAARKYIVKGMGR
jgi:hypothetical protein